MHRLHLVIPKPIEMDPFPGEFTWNEGTLLLTDGESEANRFAVDLWLSSCEQRGLALPRCTSDATERAGADFVLAQRDRLPMTLDLLASVTATLPEYLGTEGYCLEITPKRVFLVADTSAGLSYGIQTLIALLPEEPPETLPCVRIVDIPTVPIRGFMQDLGRGQTPTLETMKLTVERMAAFKLNTLFLYFEDGFHFKSHPSIGRNRDRVEPEEARELVTHARKYHVRVIPIHETIAHMEGILELPEYRALREGDEPRERSVLNLVHPGALHLLEETIADLCEVFPDPLFFAATDECLALGTRASKREGDLIGPGGLFTGHLKRLREILLNQGRRMILSPDPIQPEFFKAFGLSGFPKEFLMRTPRDVVFAPWHYGRMDAYPFGEFLREQGIDQILWGSTAHCGSLFPDLRAAAENAYTFMPFARRVGALGGVASQWDNGPGDSTLVEYDWPVIAYFAETLWNPAPRPFDQFLPLSLERLTGSGECSKIAAVCSFLGGTDSYLPWGGAFLTSPSYRQFYRPMEPHRLDEGQRERIRALRRDLEDARAVFAAASPPAHRAHDLLDAIGFAIGHVEVLVDLIEARHELAVDGRLAGEPRRTLVERLESLKGQFSRLWRQSYKTRILPLNLARFDRLIESVHSVAASTP